MDEDVAIEDIMACVGSVPDRSGADGINQELSDQFFEEAAALPCAGFASG
ncbi:hypothetical protein [Thiocystis violacea]|nr:hypothetical protein [Thiocystis violacea]